LLKQKDISNVRRFRLEHKKLTHDSLGNTSKFMYVL